MDCVDFSWLVVFSKLLRLLIADDGNPDQVQLAAVKTFGRHVFLAVIAEVNL